MSLTDTPRGNRVHIGIFGKRNSGKSTLVNALTGHETAIVSDVAGTTTDPVYKSMEIHGIGPCVIIDTAGFDDVGDLGAIRVQKTKEAAKKTDIALLVLTDADFETEIEWQAYFEKSKTPVIAVVNEKKPGSGQQIAAAFSQKSGMDAVLVNAQTKAGIQNLIKRIIRALPEDYEMPSITGDLTKDGDTVLLVMPQDVQAPKGRLILPQVQTIRDLLDKKAVVMCVTADRLEGALAALSVPPKLIITDSQVFGQVYEKKPPESKLTSFSVLFAAYKGDIDYYAESTKALSHLNEHSRVLIAEACTHAPLSEDIGREKIPNLLRKKFGNLTVDMVSGTDFPDDLSGYDLVIHCGGCMFNRKYVLSRIAQAKAQGVPMTNYGIILAALNGILDKIEW